MKAARRGIRWYSGTILLLALASYCGAQSWKPLLAEDRGIDWSQAGVGVIPAREVNCATLKPTATLEQINAALAACPSGQAVFLEPGTYAIGGTVRVPSNVTLRGAGADKTILNATGAGDAVIAMGSGGVPFRPRVIKGGAAQNSTQIELVSAAGIAVGKYLVITERNDPTYVTAAGSGGNCNWCDGGWTKDGSMARGQIVEVTAAIGNTLTVAPALYSAYTYEAVAVPSAMAASHAGVEDLQVRANNTGYATNFLMDMCAYCWLRGVEGNYADGDHVTIRWGYRDEVRDSYFSNAYLHVPGAHDSDIVLALKTSGSLIENNIIERTHEAVMPQWGAAGNVIAYNYTMGEFDSDAANVMIGGVNYHGAHPQFNLLEGNVLTAIYADSVWGSSSETTAFRNWVVGTNRICGPVMGRGTVDCGKGHYGFQAARAVQFSYLSTRNSLIGNVIGSAQMQALKGYSTAVTQTPVLEYPEKRVYEGAVGITFGYGSANDDGTGDGCGGGIAPCHAGKTSATTRMHGNFNNVSGGIEWMPGLMRKLPASFYLAGRPAWWGAIPFPAIGPDVTGGMGPGGHVFGNPAQACYTKVMKGTDGGAGSPLVFNAERCYGPWK
ncbi:glycoside hydrolase family 55 protein [Occallatibacter riparius]|uniref:Glycoside hydrolase family 55 protein n=1 Tax=Occallatibacter riparius TaxID=1002689 RepID=A0A9J7BZ91_9BACT|nr:glycoside hydrolase family 55 protein [Occallatibacter riparius]UWZ86934.1 glycoside hydrolase family 55 protein [Occallatibacter riparius]